MRLVAYVSVIQMSLLIKTAQNANVAMFLKKMSSTQ